MRSLPPCWTQARKSTVCAIRIRDGIATTLNDVATRSAVGIEINGKKIPVRQSVRGVRDPGLDPLYVANEGKLLAIVAPQAADIILETMRAHPLGRDADIIGEIVADHPTRVLLQPA
jgi:hydrogenase expression/formation protein HypE